jgi:hypothetical protein
VLLATSRCQTRIWEGSVSDQISGHQQRTQVPMEANQGASLRLTGTGFAKVAGFKNLEQRCRALCPLSTSLHHHGNAGDRHPTYHLRAGLYDDARPRAQHPRGGAWVLDVSGGGQDAGRLHSRVRLIVVASYATSYTLLLASTNAGTMSSSGAPCSTTSLSVAAFIPLGPVPIPSSLSAALSRSSKSCSPPARPPWLLF